jgi:hypothetical protein
MTKYFIIILLSLTLTKCKVDHSGIYHQKNINTTNHTIKLILYKFNHMDSIEIQPHLIYTENLPGGDLFSFLPFNKPDSAYVYVDNIFCNVYCRCLLFVQDSIKFHKCISDSFNILKYDLYKEEKIKENEYNYSFTIDEKFCTHCK